ncbi:MAG: DUF4276 family protein [Snowella sp.]|nr:DUF4276 family protein [Snowella sp.]
MTKLKVGLIVEDDTDYEAVREIIHRVLGEDIGLKKWSPSNGGCSTLRKKLTATINTLLDKGCNVFIIIHDLDRNPTNGSLKDEVKLRTSLEQSILKFHNIEKHICIPIEELEAWFWSDPKVIKHVGRGKGEASNNPHLLPKPKEALINLSKGENRKPRYSTNMNVELAKMLDLDLCSQRCPSFKKLQDFLKDLQ